MYLQLAWEMRLGNGLFAEGLGIGENIPAFVYFGINNYIEGWFGVGLRLMD